MGGVMAQIGLKVWKIDMVGTVQSNRTGAGKQANDAMKNMDRATYETIMFQHKDLPLTYAIWSGHY